MRSDVAENKGVSKSFFSGVLVLSISTVIVKVLGLVYKIPMLSYLGAEGMGYFNSAYEIFALLCVIATAGLPVALSMLVSSSRATGNQYIIKKIYNTALSIFLVIGIVGTAVMIIFARSISEIIKNKEAFLSIIAVAPSLLFICVASAIRGYFQGCSRMIPTAASQVIEALLKLILGIIFSVFAINKGYGIPVISAFAILGISVGTFVSVIFLLILKIKDDAKVRKLPTSTNVGNNEYDLFGIKTLIRMAFPITIGSALLGATRVIDMTVIIRRLQDIGYSVGVVNEIYGAYTTVAVPIFSLIPSLLAPISISLIPALSNAIKANSMHEEEDVVNKSIKLTVLFSIPASFAIALYARPIISLLFFNIGAEFQYVSLLLSLLGFSIFFSCMITTTNAILQSYGHLKMPIVSMAVGSVIKIIFAYILIGIPSINVYGAPISTFVCDLAITIINLVFLYRKTKNKYIIFNVYIKPVFYSFVSISLSFATYLLLYNKLQSIRLAFVLVIPLAIIIYFVFLFLGKYITTDEIALLPMGDKICCLINKIKERSKNKEEKNYEV